VKELKGKSINVDGPGTVQHFMLSYILEKNGLSIQDVIARRWARSRPRRHSSPGQGDAALTYEPYLSTVRAQPDGRQDPRDVEGIPVVVDVLVFKKDFIEKHPKIVKATVDSFFEALEMIKTQPEKSYEIMGSVVKQPGDAFAKSAAFIAWQDRAMNKAYYAKDHKPFVDFAVKVLKFNRVIQKEPKAAEMVDLRFQ
jgi:NitT/TauT family transport system substrate-binding protein